MLRAGSLCGRIFKAQLSATNGAGESAAFTTPVSYAMPSCRVGGESGLLDSALVGLMCLSHV